MCLFENLELVWLVNNLFSEEISEASVWTSLGLVKVGIDSGIGWPFRELAN